MQIDRCATSRAIPTLLASTRKVLAGAAVLGLALLQGGVQALAEDAPKAPSMDWIEVKPDCYVWESKPLSNERVRWDGPCEHGLAEGTGVLTWTLNSKPSDRVEGRYHRGKQNGRTVITYADGRRWEGDTRNGQANGLGLKTRPNGYRYEGMFLDNLRHGQGKATWPNGDKYAGEWRLDKANGQGVYTWKNGDKYQGNWDDGLPDGAGVYTRASGGTFSGNWVLGCFSRNGEDEVLLFGDKPFCDADPEEHDAD